MWICGLAGDWQAPAPAPAPVPAPESAPASVAVFPVPDSSDVRASFDWFDFCYAVFVLLVGWPRLCVNSRLDVNDHFDVALLLLVLVLLQL